MPYKDKNVKRLKEKERREKFPSRYREYRKAYKRRNLQKCRKAEKNRRWRNSTFLIDLFKSEGCVDCKIKYPNYVLEFHHERGKKLFPIARQISNLSTSKFLRELEKCDVLCANCHKIREWSKEHGVDRGRR